MPTLRQLKYAVFGMLFVMTDGSIKVSKGSNREITLLFILDLGQLCRTLLSPQYGWTQSTWRIARFVDLVYGGSLVASIFVPRYAFFGLAFLLVAFAIADAVYCARVFKSGEMSKLGPVKALRFMVAVTVTTLFNSIIKWLLIPLECLANEGWQTRNFSANFHGKDAACTPWAYPEILFTIPTVLILAFYCVFALTASLFSLGMNPVMVHPRAQYTGRVEGMYLFLKISASMLVFLSNVITPVATTGILWLMSIIILYRHVKLLPFHSMYTNLLRGGCYSTVLWLSFSGFVVSAFAHQQDDRTNQGLQFALLSVTPASFFAGIAVVYLRHQSLTRAIDRLRGEFEAQKAAEGHMRVTSQGVTGHLWTNSVGAESPLGPIRRDQYQTFFDRSWEQKRAFASGLEAHVTVRQLLMERNEEELPFLSYVIGRAVQEHPEHEPLWILRVALLRFVFRQPHEARAEERKLLSSHHSLNIDHQYALYALERKNYQDYASADMGNGNFHAVNLMEFDTGMSKARSAHLRCLVHMQHFWQLFRTEKKHPSNDKEFVGEALGRLIAFMRALDEASKEYEVLLSKYPQSVQLLRSFSSFCDKVLNDPWRAQAYLEQAMSFETGPGDEPENDVQFKLNLYDVESMSSCSSKRDSFRQMCIKFVRTWSPYIFFKDETNLWKQQNRVRALFAIALCTSFASFGLIQAWLFRGISLKDLSIVNDTGFLRAWSASACFLLRSSMLAAIRGDSKAFTETQAMVASLGERIQSQHKTNYGNIRSQLIRDYYWKNPIRIAKPQPMGWAATNQTFWEFGNDWSRRLVSASETPMTELGNLSYDPTSWRKGAQDVAYTNENAFRSSIPAFEDVVLMYEAMIADLWGVSWKLAMGCSLVNGLLLVAVAAITLSLLLGTVRNIQHMPLACSLGVQLPLHTVKVLQHYYRSAAQEMKAIDQDLDDPDMCEDDLEDPNEEEQDLDIEDMEESLGGGGVGLAGTRGQRAELGEDWNGVDVQEVEDLSSEDTPNLPKDDFRTKAHEEPGLHGILSKRASSPLGMSLHKHSQSRKKLSDCDPYYREADADWVEESVAPMMKLAEQMKRKLPGHGSKKVRAADPAPKGQGSPKGQEGMGMPRSVSLRNHCAEGNGTHMDARGAEWSQTRMDSKGEEGNGTHSNVTLAEGNGVGKEADDSPMIAAKAKGSAQEEVQVLVENGDGLRGGRQSRPLGRRRQRRHSSPNLPVQSQRLGRRETDSSRGSSSCEGSIVKEEDEEALVVKQEDEEALIVKQEDEEALIVKQEDEEQEDEEALIVTEEESLQRSEEGSLQRSEGSQRPRLGGRRELARVPSDAPVTVESWERVPVDMQSALSGDDSSGLNGGSAGNGSVVRRSKRRSSVASGIVRQPGKDLTRSWRRRSDSVAAGMADRVRRRSFTYEEACEINCLEPRMPRPPTLELQSRDLPNKQVAAQGPPSQATVISGFSFRLERNRGATVGAEKNMFSKRGTLAPSLPRKESIQDVNQGPVRLGGSSECSDPSAVLQRQPSWAPGMQRQHLWRQQTSRSDLSAISGHSAIGPNTQSRKDRERDFMSDDTQTLPLNTVDDETKMLLARHMKNHLPLSSRWQWHTVAFIIALGLCVLQSTYPSRSMGELVTLGPTINQAGRRRFLTRSCVHLARELVLMDGYSRMDQGQVSSALRYYLDELKRANDAVRLGGDLNIDVGADLRNEYHNMIMYGKGCPWREDPSTCDTPEWPQAAAHGLYHLSLSFFEAVESVLLRYGVHPSEYIDSFNVPRSDDALGCTETGEVAARNMVCTYDKRVEWEANRIKTLSEDLEMVFISNQFTGDLFQGYALLVEIFDRELESIVEEALEANKIMFSIYIIFTTLILYAFLFRFTIRHAQAEIAAASQFVLRIPLHVLSKIEVSTVTAVFRRKLEQDDDDSDVGNRSPTAL